MSSYLFKHTEEQAQAIDSKSKSILCLAGAGSGKTRVVVDRICRLIRKGNVQPHQILALTFTRMAAGEMRHRIAIELGEQCARAIWINTFHAVGLKMLRQFGHEIGYDSNIVIFDEQDKLDVFTGIADRMGLVGKFTKKEGLEAMQIFGATGELPDPDHVLFPIFNLYIAKMREWGCMCFSMILFETRRLLNESENAHDHFHTKFKHIFVDEFQDSDRIQYNLHNVLNSDNIFVVGDDFQSIYGFRKADINIILGFTKDHKDAEKIMLTQNFRSTSQIVDAGKNLISYNENQIPKDLFSEKSGTPFEYKNHIDVVEESRAIAIKIKQALDKGLEPKDVAILYRLHSQAQPIADFLERFEIPFNIVSPSKSLWQSSEVRRIMAVLAVVLNENDDFHFEQALKFPESRVDDKILARLKRTAREDEISLYAATESIKSTETPELNELCNAVELLSSHDLNEESVLIMIIKTVESLYLDLYYEKHMLTTRMERIEELKKFTSDWIIEQTESLNNYNTLTFLDYIKALGIEQQSQIKKEVNEVTLCTVHAAKGLEWKSVHIAGAVEGVFPHKRSIKSGDVDEERRLFYVAITRAKEFLSITGFNSKEFFGKIKEYEPSRFIEEMIKGT